MFEAQGDQPRTFYGTVHFWIDNQHTSNDQNWLALLAGFDFNPLHTYGLLWIPGTVIWHLYEKPLMSAPTPSVLDSEDVSLVVRS